MYHGWRTSEPLDDYGSLLGVGTKLHLIGRHLHATVIVKVAWPFVSVVAVVGSTTVSGEVGWACTGTSAMP